MHTYQRKVQYYETDKMGIAHHSNYVRWMEEARVDFLASIGLDYATLEQKGLGSPVIDIHCKYKKPTLFGQSIAIEIEIKEYTGFIIIFAYTMKNEAGEVVCVAESEHCFLSEAGKLLILKTSFPDIDAILKKHCPQGE